jgi:hypothetical protein
VVSKCNYDNQVKKFSAQLDSEQSDNELLDSTNKQHSKRQTEITRAYVRKYQIYCNKRHLLYLTCREFYRSIIKGHVITTLRINDFTVFGFDKKTDIGEMHGAD